MPRQSDRRLYGWEWDVWVAREELVTCITAVECSPHAGIGNGLFSGKTGKVLASKQVAEHCAVSRRLTAGRVISLG